MSKKSKGMNSNVIVMSREFKPRTKNQHDYVRAIVENDITFCSGHAGAGKTACAVGLACEYLRDRKVNRIVITRPIIETGKGLGYLPGDMYDKVHMYMLPILDEMNMYFDSFKVDDLIDKGVIEIAPLEYMRGRNFHECFMILDEAQNATLDQLKMFMTRIGKNSKCVINGDIKQSDIKFYDRNPLEYCMDRLEDVDGVGVCHLHAEDIQRHSIISRILDKLN